MITYLENAKKYSSGTRVYYTGDMANMEGAGVITRFIPAGKYAPDTVDIQLDDGRKIGGLWVLSFSPGSGRRFWLESEWQAKRKMDIERMTAYMKQLLAQPN